jgi:hypothetical protein
MTVSTLNGFLPDRSALLSNNRVKSIDLLLCMSENENTSSLPTFRIYGKPKQSPCFIDDGAFWQNKAVRSDPALSIKP